MTAMTDDALGGPGIDVPVFNSAEVEQADVGTGLMLCPACQQRDLAERTVLSDGAEQSPPPAEQPDAALAFQQDSEVPEGPQPDMQDLIDAMSVSRAAIAEGVPVTSFAAIADTTPEPAFDDPDNPLKQGIDTSLAIAGDASAVAGRRIQYAFAESGDLFDDRSGRNRAADQDWNDYEKARLAAAVQVFADVLDIEIAETSNQAEAELVFFAAEINGANSGGAFTPNNGGAGFLGFAFLPTGGSLAGNVIFNIDGFGWDRTDPATSPAGENFDGGLEQFGLGFQTMIHELGHAFGLDHPYEDDARTGFFPGIVDETSFDNSGNVVPGADGRADDIFNDAADFGLAQTPFTVMSAVGGWTEHPVGVAKTFNLSGGLDNRPDQGGFLGTLGAIDIAVLQEAYGANAGAATGDDVYLLPDTRSFETGYETIWDAGGTDLIRYQGARNATIDLRPATLQVEDGGGGFVSFVDGGSIFQGTAAIGGFTIANGAEIENAESDTGDDTLRGNELANTLSSGEGDDFVDAGGGDDSIDGGADVDTLSFASMDAPGSEINGISFGAIVDLSRQGQAQNTGNGTDTFTGFESLEGSQFNDGLFGDANVNTIEGGDGRDFLTGEAGNDTLFGGADFDVVDGGPGADVLFGGTTGGDAIETDIVAYFGSTGPLDFVFGTSFSELEEGTSPEIIDDVIGDDIEGVGGADGFSNMFDASNISTTTFFLGGRASDVMYGGSATDQLLGVAGDDVMHGNAGRDALIGEGGDDDLFGGAGDDFFFFDGINEGNDTIHDLELGAGGDVIFFTGGNVTAVRFEDATQDGGDLTPVDTLLTYQVAGEDAGTITIVGLDAATVELGANIVLM